MGGACEMRNAQVVQNAPASTVNRRGTCSQKGRGEAKTLLGRGEERGEEGRGRGDFKRERGMAGMRCRIPWNNGTEATEVIETTEC